MDFKLVLKKIPRPYVRVSVMEGCMHPRLFLPVRWTPNSGQLECWFFPLAIPVGIFYALRSACKLLWSDLLTFGHEQEKMRATNYQFHKCEKCGHLTRSQLW